MTATLFKNRIRRYLSPPLPGFWQLPPDAERTLFFILGVLAGTVLPMVFRTLGLLAR